MTTQALIDAVRTQVSADFEDDTTGHDLDHLDRVHRLSERLRVREGGDPLILGAASYVHDYHRVLERRAGDYGPASRQVDGPIRSALAAAGFPAELVAGVCECVEFTDRYSFSGHGLEPPSLEASILRDADNLDALGAIGVARAFMFGGALGEPIWVEDVEAAEIYEPGATTSVVHHFHEKLLRVRDDMLTETGRAIADERHDFMVGFLEQLQREWNGGESRRYD